MNWRDVEALGPGHAVGLTRRERRDLLPRHRLGQLGLAPPRLAQAEHGQGDDGAGHADHRERPPPPERLADPPAERQADAATHEERHLLGREDPTPHAGRVAVAEERGRGRVVDRLADAHRRPGEQQVDVVDRGGRQQDEPAPAQQRPAHDAGPAVVVGHPAGRDRGHAAHDDEHRRDEAELGVAEVPLVLEDRQHAAGHRHVDLVDEADRRHDPQRRQGEPAASRRDGGRGRFGRRFGGQLSLGHPHPPARAETSRTGCATSRRAPLAGPLSPRRRRWAR